LAQALLYLISVNQIHASNETEVHSMRTRHITAILLVLAIVGIVGFSAPSFAGWGRGGGGNCPMAGGGYGPGGGSGPWGGGADLTDEEIAALQKERNAFFEQTRDLRDKLYQKGLELRAEMAKQSPDAKKAAELQKEVSGLEGELDQKRLDQRIKMQKENPKLYGKGFGRGMGPGHGMGPGYGRGPGSGMGMGMGGGGRGPWGQ
jgi:Spy/CpxP family protein refolding chaperone